MKLFSLIILFSASIYAQSQPRTESCVGSRWTGTLGQFCIDDTQSAPLPLYVCPLNPICTQSSQWEQIGAATGTITGSGTTNFYPLWGGTTVLTNGTLEEVSGVVTTTEPFSAGGAITAGTGGTGAGGIGFPNSSGVYTYWLGGGDNNTYIYPTTAGTTGQVCCLLGAGGATTWYTPGGGTNNIFPGNVFNISDSGLTNLTFVWQIPNGILTNYANTWKIGLNITSGTATMDAITIARTAIFSTTVIDTTVITVGSLSTGISLGVGETLTDSVALAIDSTHDYYILAYFGEEGGNSSAAVGESAISNGVATTNYLYGNHTTDTSTTTFATGAHNPQLFSRMIKIN